MKNVVEIIKEYNGNCRKLKFLEVDTEDKIRFNVVTDSIASHSLLGGVATALILATLLCEKNDWKLRIITRTTECNPVNYTNFLRFYGLNVPQQGVEYVSDVNVINREASRIEMMENDIFMATSWWSAKALLESLDKKKIFYIIQEEETFFYPYGDLHLWCKDIMQDNRIDYIVNSKLLYDFLCKAGYSTLVQNGAWFEPAFSKDVYYANEKSFEKKEKYKLFFYGRPNNPRNLFYHGLEILDKAIIEHVIDTDIWDIYMAGGACQEFQFSNGYQPILMGQMSWEEYAEFARKVDVALCLMYTPHPSYPPFDMLSSGAVVLTNCFANKRDLSYSDNLILKDLNLQEMVSGIDEAIKLAQNSEKRRLNYENNKICTDWAEAFEDILNIMSQKVERGYYV